jgi:hypothetical protein
VLSDNKILAKCTPTGVGESSQRTTIVNSAEENRAKVCKFLDRKPLFSALYGMYKVTLKELKAVFKVNAQAGQRGAVKETSLESTAQDDDFQEISRRKRPISNDTSETAKKSTKWKTTSRKVTLILTLNSKSSVGDSHGKLVVEEELEVSL